MAAGACVWGVRDLGLDLLHFDRVVQDALHRALLLGAHHHLRARRDAARGAVERGGRGGKGERRGAWVAGRRGKSAEGTMGVSKRTRPACAI
eukprot:4614687-Pleurochrysis_carterae.AAC.1